MTGPRHINLTQCEITRVMVYSMLPTYCHWRSSQAGRRTPAFIRSKYPGKEYFLGQAMAIVITSMIKVRFKIRRSKMFTADFDQTQLLLPA